MTTATIADAMVPMRDLIRMAANSIHYLCVFHGHSDRPPPCLPVRSQKASDEVDRRTGRPPATEGDEDDPVADRHTAVPAAMLSNKNAFSELGSHHRLRECYAQRSNM